MRLQCHFYRELKRTGYALVVQHYDASYVADMASTLVISLRLMRTTIASVNDRICQYYTTIDLVNQSEAPEQQQDEQYANEYKTRYGDCFASNTSIQIDFTLLAYTLSSCSSWRCDGH